MNGKGFRKKWLWPKQCATLESAWGSKEKTMKNLGQTVFWPRSEYKSKALLLDQPAWFSCLKVGMLNLQATSYRFLAWFTPQP
jgi:hypothetical protein